MPGQFLLRPVHCRALGLLAAVALWLTVGGAAPALAFERHTAHGGPVKGLALSPDGRWLVSTSFDYSAVLWSAGDLIERRRLIGHEAAVNAAAFSPDGRFLVTAGDDAVLRVWSVEQLLDDRQEPVSRNLAGHGGKVVHLAFSSDGSTLASSSWDHTVGLWSAPAFDRIGVLRGHEGPVNAAAFSDDGKRLYTAGADGHVRLWDLAESRALRSVVEAGWGINVLAVSEPLDLLAFGTSSGLLQTRALHGDRITANLLHDDSPVLSLSVDPASRRLVCGNAKGRLVVADAETDEILRDFHAANGPVWTAQLVSSGQAIVYAGLDDFITRLPLDTASDEGGIAANDERRFHPAGVLDNGARQFARKCSVCHTLAVDDRRRAGPSLHGVFGRKAGAVTGYPYSDALARADIVWTEETIDALFREGPESVTPGSKMPLQRIRSADDRQDLIRFLRARTAN
ncbi:MAG: hypothetical protein KDI88_00160 [Gammaproteobacteria bacterium]|nr:hypothetical protein [Gammaproteobacteria bacterium]